MNNIENSTKSFDNLKGDLQGGSLKGALGYNPNMAKGQEGSFVQQGGILPSFQGEMEKILALGINGGAADLASIEDILDDMDICTSYNFDCANVERQDAIAFINFLNQGGVTNYAVSNEGNLIDAMNYKGIEVSKTLSSLLLNMKETGKAVRLDFDNNVTVVLKLNDGKLNAQFIPGDKAVEEYLRNNIPFLKQRFDEQNIPYANISYKQHRQRENGQNNKEKKNE